MALSSLALNGVNFLEAGLKGSEWVGVQRPHVLQFSTRKWRYFGSRCFGVLANIRGLLARGPTPTNCPSSEC